MHITIDQCSSPIIIQKDGEVPRKAWAKIIPFQPKPTDEVWEGHQITIQNFFHVWIDSTHSIHTSHAITWADKKHRVIRTVPQNKWQCILVQEI